MEFSPKNNITPEKTNDDGVAEWDKQREVGVMGGPRPLTSEELRAKYEGTSGPRVYIPTNEEELAGQAKRAGIVIDSSQEDSTFKANEGKEQKIINESGFSEEDAEVLIKKCLNVLEGGKKGAKFDLKKIDKISNTEASVFGVVSNPSEHNDMNWEIKLVKVDGVWRTKETTPSSGLESESHKKFKERVVLLAGLISGWSKKMDLESYNQLLEVEKIAGKERRLSDLVRKALEESKGVYFTDHSSIANIKTFLDSFESNVDKFLEKGFTVGDELIIERLQDLEKVLSSWNHDE